MNVKLRGERGTNTRVGEISGFVPVKQRSFRAMSHVRRLEVVAPSVLESRFRGWPSRVHNVLLIGINLSKNMSSIGKIILCSTSPTGTGSFLAKHTSLFSLPCRRLTYVLNSQLDWGSDGILNNPLN